MKTFHKGNVIRVLIVALSFSTSFAHGQDASDHCASIGYFAGTLMEKRQEGATMSELMKIVTSAEGPQQLISIAREMVIAAYEKPQYSMAANKADEVNRFRNDWELKCYKDF